MEKNFAKCLKTSLGDNLSKDVLFLLKKKLGPFYSHTQLRLVTFRLHMSVSNIIRGVGGNLIPLAKLEVLNMQKQASPF